MRHVCFLVDSIFTVGGVQRVTAVIARELSKDCRVTIVTMDDPATANRSAYGLDESNIAYRFFRYPAMGSLRRNCNRALSGIYRRLQPQSRWASDIYARTSFPQPLRKALAEELRHEAYDVIVGVHAPLAVRLASLRKQLPGVRLVGWIHNSFEALFGPTSLYIGPDRRRHYVYQMRKLDATVVLCQHDRDTYRAYDPRFLPTVIYNPLTLAPGQAAREGSKRFLAVGRFSRRHKGFDLLIEAFHLFAQKDSEWVLDIVGEGEEEPLYRELIARYGLGQRVLLHPFTANVQEYYSAAQVYVLSSRWEGFGLVLVEAMAHGLPVVSSDLPTSLEIMGNYGIYFHNGDATDLARRLAEATQIDWQKKSAAAAAIVSRFDIGQIASQWRQTLFG